MITYRQSQTLSVSRIFNKDKDKDTDTEETLIVAGKEITISQEPFVKADIHAARSVLQRLKEEVSCYSTQIVKEIEI